MYKRIGGITAEDIKKRKASIASSHTELIRAIGQIEKNANMRLWLSCGVFFALGVIVGWRCGRAT